MKIAIDVREASRTSRAGKGQWTYGFVSELLKRTANVTLLSDASIPYEWKKYKPTVHIFPSGFLWHVRAVFFVRSKKEIQTYVSPTSYIVPSFLPKRICTLPVVHDLIAFRNDVHNKKATLIERLLARRVFCRAAHILTVSTSTKNDLLKRFHQLSEQRITPIFAGPMSENPRLAESDDDTILCIGTLSPRKNQYRLIQAYAALPQALRSKYTLVLAGGRGWQDADILRLCESTTGVEWIGYVDEAQYDSLLHSCAVLALPSLYEGFGMQILDALQRGVPVLTSDRGSLPEVTGTAAVLVDPEDVSSIQAGLEKILSDSVLRATVHTDGPTQAAKFSWKRTADLFLNVLKELQ